MWRALYTVWPLWISSDAFRSSECGQFVSTHDGQGACGIRLLFLVFGGYGGGQCDIWAAPQLTFSPSPRAWVSDKPGKVWILSQKGRVPGPWAVSGSHCTVMWRPCRPTLAPLRLSSYSPFLGLLISIGVLFQRRPECSGHSPTPSSATPGISAGFVDGQPAAGFFKGQVGCGGCHLPGTPCVGPTWAS